VASANHGATLSGYWTTIAWYSRIAPATSFCRCAMLAARKAPRYGFPAAHLGGLLAGLVDAAAHQPGASR
jgi:hypothetical protein